MKLRLLVFVGLLTSLFVSAQAQTSSNDVAFLDEQGRVIPNGTVVVLNKAVSSEFPFEGNKIAGKVHLQNKSDKPLNVSLSYIINNIDEGEVQVCAFEKCTNNSEIGSYEVGDKLFSVGSDKEAIDIEHFYGEFENCSITLKLKVKEFGSEVEKEGSSITIKFDTKAAGIASVASLKGLTYDVFNTQGVLLHKQITSLSNLPKGIYIVKKKGVTSTKKYVVH
ncbi:T9SS C-terminal target domain-containing protein [Prevotella melaninogenica]|uniref:T9SS C-terminal target domain-containing protein n=1 Tax=Prevotella melaninogenica TaxID=28132 RepID=UPI001C5FDEBA|nr:T9SS C-terminal target domain-containing protein [Prevotella melaninogenica]MBW4741314.1 T9SS C-terminal target domain-containing protein [Prevotella melaninogenica]MBW4912222.1 T9SS C-terminal target domain-containing protein [Prevotella melaninogenica]